MMMTEKDLDELIQQIEVAQFSIERVAETLKEKKLTKSSSSASLNTLTRKRCKLNDPVEFYKTHCDKKLDSEVRASTLFHAYKQWCNDNGFFTQGQAFFVETIAELAQADGVVGINRNGAYTFKNLALKAE